MSLSSASFACSSSSSSSSSNGGQQAAASMKPAGLEARPRSDLLTAKLGAKNTMEQISSIYVYENDPKQVNKGVHLGNTKDAQGGLYTFISDAPYHERKQANATTEYNALKHHGSRPMHQTTFKYDYGLGPKFDDSKEPNNLKTKYLSNYHLEYRPKKLLPDWEPRKAGDQFRHHFEIGNRETADKSTLVSNYSTQFYFKNDDQEYKANFDLNPKYSVPKQINQLRKENKLNEYRNRRNNITEVIQVDKNEPTYWSQYKRIHGYLGAMRGSTGAADNDLTSVSDLRMYPDRPQYNLFTGERLEAPSWSVHGDYRLRSGNMVLDSARNHQPQNLLG